MRNKGRRQKAGTDSEMHGIANCKSMLVILTRPIEQIGPGQLRSFKKKKWMKRAWSKRVRGYFKSQTKELL